MGESKEIVIENFASKKSINFEDSSLEFADYFEHSHELFDLLRSVRKTFNPLCNLKIIKSSFENIKITLMEM